MLVLLLATCWFLPCSGEDTRLPSVLNQRTCDHPIENIIDTSDEHARGWSGIDVAEPNTGGG